MSLQDFLGKTSEIQIFDFLVENKDLSYGVCEIRKNTGLTATETVRAIHGMVDNGILKIDEKYQCSIKYNRKYKLTDNEIIKHLIAASLLHSFKQAEYDEKILLSNTSGDYHASA